MKRLLLCGVFLAVGGYVAFATGDRASTKAAPDDITFSNQVVRIFQGKCQVCHNPNGIAPFSLVTYDDAAPYADLIKDKTQSRQMPPWKPRADCGGGFADERRLSDEQIALLANWVDAGAPEGNKADLPDAIVFPTSYQNGEPDVVLYNDPKGYDAPTVDEQGGSYDKFRCFSIPTNFAVDRYISGAEIVPTPGVQVHHVLIYLDPDGLSVPLDKADPGPGYDNVVGPGFDSTIQFGLNPGARPVNFPVGTAMRIPAGSRIVMQVHYALNDHRQHDQTKLALKFARTPVYKERFTFIPKNETFTIPANDSNYKVESDLVTPDDITVLSAAPHMHFIGKQMYATAIKPDGEEVCLITVDWDIHWQGSYSYATPIHLPAGTRVHLTSFYDNSADNPNNPNSPPVDMPWAPKEKNEMQFCTFGITKDAQHLTPSTPTATAVRVSGSKLVVTGTDVRPGAFITINGKIAQDAKVKGSRVVSSAAWKKLVDAGQTAQVAILNNDGGNTTPLSFTREK